MHEEPAYSMYIEIVYNLGSIKKEFKQINYIYIYYTINLII